MILRPHKGLWLPRPRRLVGPPALARTPAGVMAGQGGGAPTTIWDSGNKHADIALTNADLTMTLGSGSGEGRNARSTTSHTTGKRGFKITINDDAGLPGAESIGIGLCAAAFDIGNETIFLGEDADSIGVWDTGNTYLNYVLDTTAYLAAADTTTFDETGNNEVFFLVDLSASPRTFWIKNNVDTDWNQDAGADPSANTGGHSLAARSSNLGSGALFICVELDNAGQQVTLDPSGAGLPTGYTGGW